MGIWLKRLWFLISRLTWLVAFLLAIGVVVYGGVAHYAALQDLAAQQDMVSAQVGLANLTLVLLESLAGLVSIGLAAFTFSMLCLKPKPGDRMALFASFTLLFFGVIVNPAVEALTGSGTAWEQVKDWFIGLGGLTFFIFLFVFPDGRFVPRWVVLVPLLLPAWFLLWAIVPALAPSDLSDLQFSILAGVWLAVGAAAQLYRYLRASSPTQRQQTKWVAFSLTLTVGFGFVELWLDQILPQLYGAGFSGTIVRLGMGFFGFLAYLLLPLSISLAILRYKLWDIDILIRRTLIYGALTITLALVYFGSVLILQSAFTALAGGRSPVVVIFSTLSIAALFNPLRRRIQEAIDLRFYRSKYNAQQTLEAFNASLRGEVNLDDLAVRLVDVVNETLQPESSSLWLKPDTNVLARSL